MAIRFIWRKPTASTIVTGQLVTHQFLQQRYHLLESVGKGGMGVVYSAEDTHLGHRQVAIKEMSQSHLSLQEVEEAAEAFKREAHLLAGLHHPNLPHIYEHFFEEGRWYLVMSFIHGEALEAALARTSGGKLPREEALRIGIQVSTVLSYLHTRQPPIIFRDLKPSNIMLTPEGHLYLIDFGIARHFKTGQTKDTTAYGSAGYASPEQYGKAQTTPQSDIYSLGALLHQMLSGNDPSESPFHFAPLQIPGEPELAALISSMLQMDAQQRPASMEAVKQFLEERVSQPQTRAVSQWQNQRPVEPIPETRRVLYSQPRAHSSQQHEYAAQQEEQPSPPSLQVSQQMRYALVSPQLVVLPQRKNGLVIAGFVCGLIGVFLGWILVGLPFSLIGLVLSAIGMVSSERKGMAIAGLVLSVLGIGIAVMMYIIVIIFSIQ